MNIEKAIRSVDRDALTRFLTARRWFGAKGRAIADATIDEVAAMPDEVPFALTRVAVRFADGGLAHYQLPLALRAEDPARPDLVLARAGGLALVDAVHDPEFLRALGRAFAERDTAQGAHVRWEFEPLSDLSSLADLPTRVIGGEQSNTSIVFGDRAIMKLYRRLEPGIQPDVEVARFLTTRTQYTGTPALLGVLHLRGPARDGVAGMIQRFMPGSVDGWAHVLAGLERAAKADASDLPDDLLAELGALGRRTRELHEALRSVANDPSFSPEPTRPEDLERWRAATRTQLDASLGRLAAQIDALPGAAASSARALIARQQDLVDLLARPLQAAGQRIRHHGDYHLGQVLRTADGDWQIIDFEGEPARPLAERRAKHHPLRDVAGMLRSFAYAAAVAVPDAERRPRWQRAMSSAFIGGYDPALRQDDPLLALFVAEKTFYELAYELGNRPDWTWIPLAGIDELLS